MATIKELVLEVANGNLSGAEIYEDFFASWGESKQDEFLNRLLLVIVQFQRGDSCWGRSAYDRCKTCYGYLSRLLPSQSEQQASTEQETAKAERVIDETTISSWFNSRFKGAGGNQNHLPDIILDLKRSRSNKDFAKIALLIYESKFCVVKAQPFSKFYKNFCSAVGCQMRKYDPCNLRDEIFARQFTYLQ